jgi:cytochrome c-type biogenesis protein CcmE
MHLIAMVALLAAVLVFINSGMEFSKYATFEEAQKSGERVKIVGQLQKEKEIYYNPLENPNYFSFYLLDNQGVEKKVVLNSAKPQDFELSEEIVLTGRMEGDLFKASDILLKCPSKYKDEEVYLREKDNS